MPKRRPVRSVKAEQKLKQANRTLRFLLEQEKKKNTKKNPSTKSQSFLSDPEGITIRLIKGSGEQLKKILGRSFRVSSTKGKRKNPTKQYNGVWLVFGTYRFGWYRTKEEALTEARFQKNVYGEKRKPKIVKAEVK